MQTKGKNRKNGKLGKLFVGNANDASHPDLSSLRKPIDTSMSDLSQVSRLLEDGTDEVKAILSYECSIIYECRVCQSLFRSIVNLVSHKREFCKEKFNITFRKRVLNNYNMHSSRKSMIHMFKTEQTNNEESIKNDRILRSQVSKEPNKKDLSAIIDMINEKRKEHIEKQAEEENAISNDQSPDDQPIYLKAADINCSAVYQTVKSSDAVVDAIDLMKEEIIELQNITDKTALVVNGQMSENQLSENQLSENQLTENQFSENQLTKNQLSEKSDSPIQRNMSDEDEESELLIYRLPMNNLSCSLCNAKFSTRKTLTVHMKTLHTFKRLCYPCPCCANTFANTWSVYRHLYKVHKKTNEQVRKLRLQIQKKAFHRKTTAMRDIENVCAAKVSALENAIENSEKTQELTSHTEPNTKLCGKHGRKLKATLSYMQCYQTPIATCDETIRNEQCNKLLASISDDVREADVNLVADTFIKPSDMNILSENSEYTMLSPEICNHEASIRVQTISSFNKEPYMPGNEDNHLSERNLVDSNNDFDVTPSQSIDNSESPSSTENQDNFVSDENSKSSDLVSIEVNEVDSVASELSKKEEALSQHNDKQLTNSKEGDEMETEENNFKSQSLCSPPNEKNRASLIDTKVTSIANFRKQRCLLCDRKFTSIPNLRRHVAIHVGWNRYSCKLCDFKSFVKCECVLHCNKVHNMQNSTAIAEMILEIPPNEYTYNEDIITNATSLEKKLDNSDITDDSTASSCQQKMRVNSDSCTDLETHATSQSTATATKSEQVAESHRSVERQNIDVNNSDKIVTSEVSESVLNNKKLDDNPELKRMIMEVIFGSTDVSTIVQAESSKSTLETNDDASRQVDANDNINNITIIDESKEASYSILENVRHQRPTRNRQKRLNNDFVYDLKEIAHRKESAFTNDSETLHIQKKSKLIN
ncbi:uncharacterized protein LOC105205655 isoform X2 [Solenopsis invicta]|nr:uncharacterized protein LOC105205655 isoform X2 [Solenopsis invicta]